MAEVSTETDVSPKKGGMLPILLGLGLALAGAGAGYGVVTAGLLPLGKEKSEDFKVSSEKVAFVPIDPLIISVGTSGHPRHLRFQAQLEVVPGNESAVHGLLPRVSDVLNGYLRAVDVAELEDPRALVMLRAQMLRRVQIVVGEGLVSDLLVGEFVLN